MLPRSPCSKADAAKHRSAIKSTESENLGFIIISLRLNYRWIWTGVPVTSPISDSAAEQFLAVVHHRLYVAEPSTALPKFGGFRRGLLGLTITMNNNRFSGVFPVYWTEFVWAPGFRTVRHAPWKDRNPGLAFARRYTARWSGSTTLFRYGRCDTGRAPRLPLRSSPHRNRQMAVYFGHPGASALSIHAPGGAVSFPGRRPCDILGPCKPHVGCSARSHCAHQRRSIWRSRIFRLRPMACQPGGGAESALRTRSK